MGGDLMMTFTDNARLRTQRSGFPGLDPAALLLRSAKDPTVDDKTRREVAGLTPSRVSRFRFRRIIGRISAKSWRI